MDDCLTHIVYWRSCSGMIIPLGKNMLMLQRAWRLGYWCAYATTIRWHLKTQLHCPIFLLSYIPGKHLNISDRSWEFSLPLRRSDLLKFKKLNWIHGFPKGQSHIYASLCTKNRVLVFADKFFLGQHFSAQLQCCLVSLVMFQLLYFYLFLWYWMKMPWWDRKSVV